MLTKAVQMWIVDIIKAIAWPAAILLIAYWLKPAFSNLISSLLKRPFSFEGLGLRAMVGGAEQKHATLENPTSEKLPAVTASGPSTRPALDLIEANIIRELESVKTEDKEALLLRALTQTRLEHGHEFIYNRIFGSQILALKRLNEVGYATVENAKEFLGPYIEAYPQLYENYGLEDWLNFLLANGLIQKTGSTLSITEIGRDFLLYITEKRLSESKLF